MQYYLVSDIICHIILCFAIGVAGFFDANEKPSPEGWARVFKKEEKNT